jgi:hypothetical protein
MNQSAFISGANHVLGAGKALKSHYRAAFNLLVGRRRGRSREVKAVPAPLPGNFRNSTIVKNMI